MTPMEVIEVQISCKGQYPRMTEEQVRGLADQLRNYSRGSAERALIDMAREIEDWSTSRFIAIVRRCQIEINDERQREANTSRYRDQNKFAADYELAERAAAETPDEELRQMRDELFARRPDLRDTYGANVNARKRRSLLVMMFVPASEAARAGAAA